MRTIGSLALLGALAACATTSEVVPMGSNSYMVAASGKVGGGSAAEQKAIALRLASDYCNARALQMRLIDSRLTDPGFGKPPAAEIDFACEHP